MTVQTGFLVSRFIHVWNIIRMLLIFCIIYITVGSMGKLSLTKSPSVPDPGLSTYASTSGGGMSSSASVDTSIAASKLIYYCM